MAKLRMVQIAERERDYDGAIALSREVFADAQKGGMLMMASRATSELGYAYVYQRKFQEALPYLRQSVELAKHAKSHGLFASNSLKLGEVLGTNGKAEEAVEVLEGAVQWYRQAGMDNMLPLILIKWGGALSATSRRDEAEPVFLEAYKLAEKNGEPLYQAMAMQRLGNFHAPGNLRKSADYFENAVVLGRETLLTLAYFQAAEMWSQLGKIERARQLVDEGEKEVNEKYPKGTDQTNFLNIIIQKRAVMLYRQGFCDQALVVMSKMQRLGTEWEKSLRRMRACSSNSSTLRSDYAWFETSLAEAIHKQDNYSSASLAVDIGDLSLRLKNWRSAKRSALRGIEASRSKHLRSKEMENTLVLRAAEAQLGNGAEAQRLSSEALKLAKEVGFEKPGEFVGRQDLLFFWRLGGRAIQ